MPANTTPAEETTGRYCFLNAYKVVRKAPQPGPNARVATHGYVVGSIMYRAGNSRDKRRAYKALYEQYSNIIRMDGAIYKHPDAVALWIYGESLPAENWADTDDE